MWQFTSTFTFFTGFCITGYNAVAIQDDTSTCSADFIEDSPEGSECLTQRSSSRSNTEATFPFWSSDPVEPVVNNTSSHNNSSLLKQKVELQLFMPVPYVQEAPVAAYQFNMVYRCWYDNHKDFPGKNEKCMLNHCQKRCEPNNAKFAVACCKYTQDSKDSLKWETTIHPMCEEHLIEDGTTFNTAQRLCHAENNFLSDAEKKVSYYEVCQLEDLVDEPGAAKIWANDYQCTDKGEKKTPTIAAIWTRTPCDPNVQTTTTTTIVMESAGYITRGCYGRCDGTNEAECHQRCEPRESFFAVACCGDNDAIYGACKFRMEGAQWSDAVAYCQDVAEKENKPFHICSVEELKFFWEPKFWRNEDTNCGEEIEAGKEGYQKWLDNSDVTPEDWKKVYEMQETNIKQAINASTFEDWMSKIPTGSVYSDPKWQGHTINQDYDFFPFWTNQPCKLQKSLSAEGDTFNQRNFEYKKPVPTISAYDMCFCDNKDDDFKDAMSVCGYWDLNESRYCYPVNPLFANKTYLETGLDESTITQLCKWTSTDPSYAKYNDFTRHDARACFSSDVQMFKTHDRFFRAGIKSSIKEGVQMIKVSSLTGKKICQPRDGRFSGRCCNNDGRKQSLCSLAEGANFDTVDRACTDIGMGWRMCTAEELKAPFEPQTGCPGHDNRLYWISEACGDNTPALSNTKSKPGTDNLLHAP